MGLRERMLGKTSGNDSGANGRTQGMDPAQVRQEYERQQESQETQRQVNAPEVTDDPEKQREMSIEHGRNAFRSRSRSNGSSGNRETLTQEQVLEALEKGQCRFSAKKGGDLPQVHGKSLKALLKAEKIASYDKQGDEYIVTRHGDEQRSTLPPESILARFGRRFEQGRTSSSQPSVQSLPRELPTDTEILDRSDKWMRIFEALARNEVNFSETLEHHAEVWERFLSDMRSA